MARTPMHDTIDQLLALDPRLRRIARRIAADPHDADDLVQDVWLAVLTDWPGNGCELEPWALQVLRNAAAKRARRLRPAALDVELGICERETLETRTPEERRELEQHLRACIETLPEPYRGTVVERFYASRSVGDIAAGRGIPRATVSTHLRRALERLRSRLGRARDLFGLAPGFFPRGRVHPLAQLAPRGSRLYVRGLALACAVSPFAIALAWAKTSTPRELDRALASVVERAEPRGASSAPEVDAGARVALAAERSPELLRAEVRDAVSSAPLAERLVRVWDEGGAVHDRLTDAGGNCTLPPELASQWLVAALADEAAGSAPFRRFARAEGDSLRLAFGQGPLVRASFHAPRGLHPAELACGLRTVHPGSLTSRALPIGPGERDGEWTLQLPADWSRMTDLRDVALHVETPDGLLAGDARITDAALALREVLAIWLEPRAVLEVAIEGWEQLQTTGVVFIEPRGSERAWIAQPSARGGAQVGGLAPGPYRVSVVAARSPPWTRDVELAAGARESLSVRLEPSAAPGEGALRGAIRCAPGGYDGAIVVALEGGSAPQFARARWTETEAGRAACFEFRAVVEGHTIARPVALDGLPSFEPPFLAIPQGGEPLAFTCRGERPRSAITCDVRAAGSLTALERVELELELAGGTRVHYLRLDPAAGEPPRWAVSSGTFRWKVRAGEPWDWIDPTAEVRWTLSAPGFLGARGDQGAWSSGAFRVELEAAPAADGAELAAGR